MPGHPPRTAHTCSRRLAGRRRTRAVATASPPARRRLAFGRYCPLRSVWQRSRPVAAFRNAFSLARSIGSVCRSSLSKNSRLSPVASVNRFSSSAWLEDHFYQGEQIVNQVTWRADGPQTEAQASHAFSIGHYRLWNFTYGKILDIGELNVGQRCVYTTAQSGTFYLTIKYGQHWVTLVIDGREGWVYGFLNKNGKFEFKHSLYHYLKYIKGSKILKNVEGSYSAKKGICPDGLHSVRMGIVPVEAVVQVLSKYNGEDPVPIEVCEACVTLLIYGPESAKLYKAFEVSNSSIMFDDIALGTLRANLPRRLHKWNTMGESLLHVSARMLDEGVFVDPKPSSVSGVCTIEDLLAEVAFIPWNRTVDTIVPHHKRKWQAFPANPADGKPHVLSKDFVPMPSPMVFDKLLKNYPRGSFLDPSTIAAIARAKNVARGEDK